MKTPGTLRPIKSVCVLRAFIKISNDFKYEKYKTLNTFSKTVGLEDFFKNSKQVLMGLNFIDFLFPITTKEIK